VQEKRTDQLAGDVDAELWFEMDGCDGRHYLVDDNPNIPGRMYAYCPTKGTVTRVSKSDIIACSDATTYFVRGFLAGTQPAPPVDDEGMLSQDPSAVDAWRAAARAYRESGVWRS
jgi:hypothetical protein